MKRAKKLEANVDEASDDVLVIKEENQMQQASIASQSDIELSEDECFILHQAAAQNTSERLEEEFDAKVSKKKSKSSKKRTVSARICKNKEEEKLPNCSVLKCLINQKEDNHPINAEEKAEFKYTIKCKTGDLEQIFYLNDNDPVEILYNSLLGADSEKKLYYEDMKLSKFLLASEAGFFPGVNYIYLPENEESENQQKEKFAVIKFNENTEFDMKYSFGENETGKDLFEFIKNEKKIETVNKVILYNGIPIDCSLLLGKIIENGAILDVFNSSDIS
ncbi:hypothetical protein GINT2_001318 [Glugoides intestinalis]